MLSINRKLSPRSHLHLISVRLRKVFTCWLTAQIHFSNKSPRCRLISSLTSYRWFPSEMSTKSGTLSAIEGTDSCCQVYEKQCPFSVVKRSLFFSLILASLNIFFFHFNWYYTLPCFIRHQDLCYFSHILMACS